ncbi:glycosyltransferase [Providencia rettgeri]|nr:glycosyltransferase [Providencia rettgeri]EMB8479488.1 glycosyltransferase [Providencia rettgeri]MCB4855700.1 glycosyltransferase [Providencia rettgeri]MCD6316657.1 glycosyltransferase [Providencia rettgeri]
MKNRVLYIFNCTTNTIGGAVQNSVNFIRILHENNKNRDWYFVLSENVHSQLKDILIPGSFSVFESPANNFTERKKIYNLVKKIDPILVYTNAGPAYIKFHCLHIMGCSNPYILGASKQALKMYGGIFKRAFRYLHTSYQRYYIKKSNYWILQTHQSANLLSKQGIDIKKCNVIFNSISHEFLSYFKENIYSHNILTNDVNILVPSAYYPHKNLKIIPDICEKLIKLNLNPKFILTIDKKINLLHLFSNADPDIVNNHILNIGPYPHSKALSLYTSSDIIFQPSLLEVFSTTYIEAIATHKPLIIADLPFSRDICKEYAFYFMPNDTDMIVRHISDLIKKPSIMEEKQKISHDILKNYGSQLDRFNKIYSYINYISGINNV